MSKLAIGLLAFAAGAAVGAIAVKMYVERHALGLVLQGATDKLFGQGSSAGKIAADLGDAVQGLG